MSTHRILLIEDDVNEAKLARLTLNKIDPELEVTRLADGGAFLDYYHNNIPHEDVSLAIMDLHMPSVGGLDVLQTLMEQGVRPSFPIVLFTSSENSKEVSRAYELGGTAFVTKPTLPSDYRQALRNIVNFWVSTNRLK